MYSATIGSKQKILYIFIKTFISLKNVNTINMQALSLAHDKWN